MGFYLRKSLRVGPIRFNLSKSGIGVSGGVKGFRLGTGPRGNYVHMGRGGLYYRKTLPSKNKTDSIVNPKTPDKPVDQLPDDSFHEPLTDIESGDISQMVDSSSVELVNEMNNKNKKIRLWPIATILSVIITLILYSNSFPVWVIWLAVVCGVLISGVSYYYDELRKSTVLLYELESDIEKLYESLHDAFAKLTSCASKWHVEAEGDVKDRKRSAGASSVIKRTKINLGKGAPPYVKTNISVPYIPVGKQKLYFFPDKVLVFESNAVGAVSYSNLKLSIESTRFIEDGSVPRDAQVVDRTWKFVNKRGGPDKRFKDNKELSIVLYEDIHFTSSTGLNERIQLSKSGLSNAFSTAISQLATNAAQ